MHTTVTPPQWIIIPAAAHLSVAEVHPELHVPVALGPVDVRREGLRVGHLLDEWT